MKLPRVWFTVRRMMVAVAILAVGLAVAMGLPGWADRRRARMTAIGYRHAFFFSELSRQRPPAAARVLEYHDAMRKKYYHAAQHPWLPVLPDPQPPE